MAAPRSTWLATKAVWVLALALQLVGIPALGAAVDEVGVMRKLRAGLLACQPRWADVLAGWRSDDTSHPCTWQQVACDRQQRITTIKIRTQLGSFGEVGAGHNRSAASATCTVGPLIAELAQLSGLEMLYLDQNSPTPGCIPSEWGLPGAFPRLKTLSLSFLVVGNSCLLPRILPGALPRLEHLEITANLQSTLPVSWGSIPSVLPSLTELSIKVQVVGQLPVEWANGFQELRQLSIDSHSAPSSTSLAAAAPAALATPRTLPPEWARGFPKLNRLVLVRLGLVGTIPAAWDQGFPALNSLVLNYNNLSGTLPTDIFRTHPILEALGLAGNRFFGTLPEAWGSSATVALSIDVAHNALTGSAFPPAWIAPGAMAQLRTLFLSNNPGLQGALPESLTWQHLIHLRVEGTGMHGSIPASWCTAPFVAFQKLTKLNISLTAIGPTVPACGTENATETLVASIAPTVRRNTYAQFASSERMHRQVASRATAGPAASVQPYWLLAALCGLVAAGATGRVLWHRRLRQHSNTRLCQGLDQTICIMAGQLPLQDITEAGSCDPEAGGASAAAQVGPNLPARRRKRAELAALLSAQIRHTHSRVQLLPLPVLSPRAMHHLNPPLHHSQNCPSGATTLAGTTLAVGSEADAQPISSPEGSAHCAGADEGAAHGWSSSSQSTLQTLFSPSTAAVGAHWQADRTTPLHAGSSSPPGTACFHDLPAAWGHSSGSSLISESSSGDESAAALVASRKWGLPTHSLHLPITELAFRSDKDGHPLELDAGAHAAVYWGRLRGEDVAVKVFELQPHLESHAIWREARMLRQCMHERIVPLYGVALHGQLLMLAMPMMSGSLRSALRCPAARDELRWEARGQQVAVDAAEGLAFLHGRLGVMHGDMKPGNVLLTEDFRASLSDLGLAQVLGNSARTVSGFSRYYAAPEQLMGQPCTIAADMYSFGILLAELTTRELGVKRGDWRLPNAPQECPQSVLSLIQACLSLSPAQRPTAAQALQVLSSAGGD